MNILVTGGAGFIGSHLVDALVALGHQVAVLDDLSTGHEENLNPGCRLVRGDIRDRSCVESCATGKEIVFHLAAYTSVPGSMDHPQTCMEINVDGTRKLLESSVQSGVSRFIFSTTSAVYPEFPDTPKSEAAPVEATSPYAESKLRGESLLSEFHREKGLGYMALRYFNVYGPRQGAESDYASVIPAFINRCQRGEDLIIYGDGGQTRDFVYVADVVRANLLAMASQKVGIFNVGTSEAVSVLNLAETISHTMGSSSRYLFEAPRPGDVRSSTADISLISSQLDWRPQWGLKAGLEETIRWSNSQVGSVRG